VVEHVRIDGARPVAAEARRVARLLRPSGGHDVSGG
jgi:hypothetical protein